jgi:hypothetical protein
MARQTAKDAALRAAARAIGRAGGGGDVEAQQIARDVYATCVAARPDAGKAPLWAIGPIQYVATVASEAIVKRYRLDADQGDEVAAYLAAGLSDVLLAAVGGFDREHFERWRADQL